MAGDRPARRIANRRTIARLSDPKLMKVYEVEFKACDESRGNIRSTSGAKSRDRLFR